MVDTIVLKLTFSATVVGELAVPHNNVLSNSSSNFASHSVDFSAVVDGLSIVINIFEPVHSVHISLDSLGSAALQLPVGLVHALPFQY